MRKKKIKKILFWVFGSILGLLIIAFTLLSIYVSANKKELIAKATTEISNVISGTVTIDDVSVSIINNFPYLSLQIDKISVHDSLYSKHKTSLLYVEKLFVRVNPAKILIGRFTINKLQIKNGGINIFTDSTGYSNGYLLAPKKDSTKKEKTPSNNKLFDKIEINNFGITLNDVPKHKLYDFLINKLNVNNEISKGVRMLNISKSILVRSFAFNTAQGSYAKDHVLEGDYLVQFDPAKKTLKFDSIPMIISKQPFQFTGLFKLGSEQTFDLYITSENILVDFAKTLLTPKIAKGVGIVTVKTPINVKASIGGSLAGGDPLVLVKWETQKNELITPFLQLTNCSFSGLYYNEVVPGLERNDPNSKIEVYNLKGDWHGLTMQSDTIVVKDLKMPTLSADLRSNFVMKKLNETINNKTLKLTEGSCKLSLQYKGPIANITPENASLNGSFNIQNGNILTTTTNSTLTNCNAAIRFVNSDIIIDSLSAKLGKSAIRFSGEAKDALALLGESKKSPALTLNVTSNEINIDSISTLVSGRTKSAPVKKKEAPEKQGGLAKTAAQVDNLLSSGKVSMNFKAGKIIYHKFKANNVQANVLIDGDTWHLQNASLLHGNGSLAINAKVTNEGKNQFVMRSGLKMKNLDAQRIWYELDNFGIPVLSSQNIKGTLSADANISLSLKRTGGFDMNTLNGDASFSIKNGALIKFKPVENIHVFLFKDRNFSDIEFAEIKDKITFKQGMINIERMEINSSALSLYVEGIYGLSGGTNLSIQVPLKNLKKHKADYKPENTGTNKGGGMSVFLRVKSDEKGETKINYDLLARFKKSPKIEDPKKETKKKA